MEARTRVAGIVLAAGSSTRFGAPKQLALFRGRPLVRWAVEAALASKLARVILVLGHRRRRVEAALGPSGDDPRLEIVVNRGYREGLGSSVRTGLERAGLETPAVMFLPADQPRMDAATIDLLLARYHRSGKQICVPVFGGRRGNPTIFGRRWYARILSVRGDTGARSIIEGHPECVLFVPLPGPAPLLDVDTPGDLERMTD